jgi:hypothetical protein
MSDMSIMAYTSQISEVAKVAHLTEMPDSVGQPSTCSLGWTTKTSTERCTLLAELSAILDSAPAARELFTSTTNPLIRR